MADWSQIGVELLRHRRLRALPIAARLAAARGLWGIDASAFLMLGMHEQPIRRWSDKVSYRSELEPVLRTINWAEGAKRLTVDKLVTAARFAQAGIASAPLIAVIGRDVAAHPLEGAFAHWTDIDEIARALPGCPERLLVKPATGWRGTGIFGPERNGGGWAVFDETMSDRQLAEHLLKTAPPSGWLLQERVRSHSGLAPIGGELGLGTVRINTALTPEGPEIVFVFGKIMGSTNLVDNFSGGKFGNMLARLDKESGRITRVAGRRAGQRFLLEPVVEHPVTGAPLVGFQMPLWDEAIALAKRVATAFPEAPLVGADVAITDEGPLVIEVQSDWDANGAELALGHGLRPLLRDLIPRLALSDALKKRALEHIAVSGRARRGKPSERQGRA
jgi:hypothetical protein